METAILNQPLNLPPIARTPLWEKSRGSTSINHEMVNSNKASGLWTRSKGYRR